MKRAKKRTALLLTLILTLTAANALAATLEPKTTEIGHLAAQPLSATVGAYDAEDRTFAVTLYDVDRYEKAEAEKLTAGDLLLAGGRLHRIVKTEIQFDLLMITCEDGEEIFFVPAENDGDEVIAQSSDDDRLYMRVIGQLHLPAAEGITLVDSSDPESDDPIVTVGLEGILKVKAEKEETSIGLDYCATTITLNEAMEITEIRLVFDVSQ